MDWGPASLKSPLQEDENVVGPLNCAPLSNSRADSASIGPVVQRQNTPERPVGEAIWKAPINLPTI